MPDEFEIRFADSDVAPLKLADDKPKKVLHDEFDDNLPEPTLAPAVGKSNAESHAEIQAEVKAQLGDFHEEPTEEKMVWQFSLKELMQVTFFCAIAFGTLRLVPSDLFAGVLGLVTFLGLAVLTLAKPQRMVFYLAWWSLLGVYVIASVIAIINKNG